MLTSWLDGWGINEPLAAGIADSRACPRRAMRPSRVVYESSGMKRRGRGAPVLRGRRHTVWTQFTTSGMRRARIREVTATDRK